MRVIWLRQDCRARTSVRRMCFHVVLTNGVGENRQQIIDAQFGRLHQCRDHKATGALARMNHAPSGRETGSRRSPRHENLSSYCIAERTRRCCGLQPASSTALRAQLRGVKAVEQNRPPAALRVADFADEDCFLGRVATAIKLKIAVADHLDQVSTATLPPRRSKRCCPPGRWIWFPRRVRGLVRPRCLRRRR